MDKIVTMKQQVYNILKKRIADGTYRHGQRLQEPDLAKELNVSRSPVREAIKELVMEGILIDTPNKGAALKVFTEKEIADIYALRILIECAAVDTLAQHPELIPDETLEKIRISLSVTDKDEIDYVVNADINPHDAYMEAAENEYILDVYRRASFCTMSYHRALFAGENYPVNLRQHLDITEALLDRRFEDARAAVIRHLQDSKEIICRAIREGSI